MPLTAVLNGSKLINGEKIIWQGNAFASAVFLKED